MDGQSHFIETVKGHIFSTRLRPSAAADNSQRGTRSWAAGWMGLRARLSIHVSAGVRARCSGSASAAYLRRRNRPGATSAPQCLRAVNSCSACRSPSCGCWPSPDTPPARPATRPRRPRPPQPPPTRSPTSTTPSSTSGRSTSTTRRSPGPGKIEYFN
jgi:hypothetical protein